MGFKEDNIFKYVREGDIERVIAYLGFRGGLSFEKLQKESDEIANESWVNDENIFKENFSKTFTEELLKPFGDYAKFVSSENTPGSSNELSTIQSSAQVYYLDNVNIPDDLLPTDITREESVQILEESENSIVNSTVVENPTDDKPKFYNKFYNPIGHYLNTHESSFVKSIGKILSVRTSLIQTIVALAILVHFFGGNITGSSTEYHWIGVLVFITRSFFSTAVTIGKPLAIALGLLLKYIVAPVSFITTRAVATTASDTFLGLVGIVQQQSQTFGGRGIAQTLGAYFISAVFISLLLRLTRYFHEKKRRREIREFGMNIIDNYTYQ